MHVPTLVLALLASALPAPPGAGRTPQPAAALVRRCVDAYGGKAALARAAVTRQEGRVTSILHPEPGRIVRAYARPGRLRVETAFPGSPPEARVLDGGRGWRNGEEVESARLASMILQAARLDLPALLSAWVERIEDHGTAELDGRTVRVVAIEPAPGLVVEALIDPDSARILRSRGASRDRGMPLEFVTTYEDFRTVEGVLVPFREKNWANGRSTGETVLEKVEFPKSLGPEVFRP